MAVHGTGGKVGYGAHGTGSEARQEFTHARDLNMIHEDDT